jgi:trehalose 2-sulfotransferase
MVVPHRSYLVCATPRSGSTLLCRALTQTGIAGRPEEYFEARRETGHPPAPRDYFAGAERIDLDALLGREHPAPPAPEYSSLEGVDDYRDHIAATLERGTTPNGVFGAKIMWGHLGDLSELVGAEPPELFGRLLQERGPSPFLHYVWVSRRDRVRQAVSLWKALQTQAWAADDGDGAGHEPVYSYEAIDHLRALIAAHDRAWMAFFDTHGIEPLAVTYEQVAADLPGVVRSVLEYLDLDAAAADGVRPPMERQADARSDEWVERYERDAAEVTV